MAFAAPSTGDTLTPEDVNGHLLIVEPIEYVPNIATSFGEKDAIKVNVHDVSTQSTSENVLWFSMALVGSLKNSIGQQVLAVMGKGTAKAGQSAPWTLIDASTNEAAIGAATAYLAAHAASKLSAPMPVATTTQPWVTSGVTAAPVSATVTIPPTASAPPQQDALTAALGNLAAAGMTA
jgi:hypothetical protein